jgi:hypothetical protein
MSQLDASSGFLSDSLSQSQADVVADASQRAADGADDRLMSQGEFGFYGYASQGSQMDFDFKEGSASQASDWAHAVPGQLDDGEGIAGVPARSRMRMPAASKQIICSDLFNRIMQLAKLWNWTSRRRSRMTTSLPTPKKCPRTHAAIVVCTRLNTWSNATYATSGFATAEAAPRAAT